MAFNIKPFKELIGLTKEALDATMLPLRVRAARAKAEGEVIKLEEQLLRIETAINQSCAEKELNFTSITNMMDEYELTERKLKQINTLVAQLFPAA